MAVNARRMLRPFTDAEDAVQETVLRACSESPFRRDLRPIRRTDASGMLDAGAPTCHE